jgi:hypothetical protein
MQGQTGHIRGGIFLTGLSSSLADPKAIGQHFFFSAIFFGGLLKKNATKIWGANPTLLKNSPKFTF